jgi:hypothetical protein
MGRGTDETCEQEWTSPNRLLAEPVNFLYYSLALMDRAVTHVGGVLRPTRAWAALTRPVDALPLDLFRVCVGLVLLAYFVRTFLEAADFSGPDGLLDHELVLEIYWFTAIGLFRPMMGVGWFQAAFAIACACCVPLILGFPLPKLPPEFRSPAVGG